jgi:thioredoxin-related protein
MRKLSILILLFVITNILNASSLKYASSYKDGVLQAKKENKKLLLYTYTKYCPWCLKMSKTTFRDKQVIDYVNKNYIFVKVDINNDKFPSKFKPKGVPTTYIIDPFKEEKLISMRGYKSAKSFYSRIEK